MAQDTSTTSAGHDTPLPSREEEARNLATEAMEEIKAGNKEEGDFLMAEAKNLDPSVAAEAGPKKKGGDK